MKSNSDRVGKRTPSETAAPYGIAAGGASGTLALSWLPATLTGKSADQVDGFHASQTPGTANNAIVAPASGKISTSGAWFHFFESSEQTITSGDALTLPHGLGTQPKLVIGVIVCKTAEFNYSIGQEVFVQLGAEGYVGGLNTYGVAVVPDGTNLNVRYGSNASVFGILNLGTGGFQNSTNANWKLILRAWA